MNVDALWHVLSMGFTLAGLTLLTLALVLITQSLIEGATAWFARRRQARIATIEAELDRKQEQLRRTILSLADQLAAERGWESLTAGATPEAARTATQTATAHHSGPETPKAAPTGGLAEPANLCLDLPGGVCEDADCSNPLMVDLGGGLSKLAPLVTQIAQIHGSIGERQRQV